ncbi:hypothetical protein N836_00960 [Leptolyngbya sp. Heron Island J]|uniref:hypothetical protein n=1 Tax=Leptolyngbya sp. Heron Island J TaxID=1385935 RepID=UPI0003B978C8|nr:hypothetical protein [Leptolyngbya sp. Heron Island J]ESA36478.1 hypothetical protein N836_00960 [Leptolyngbya sp. Heron Island J]
MSFFPILKLDDFIASLADDVKADILAWRLNKKKAALRLREALPTLFDLSYVENAILPAIVTSVFQGERHDLPMIDLKFTKEEALPFFFWGMLYDSWEPELEKGLSVFIQGYENRGEENRRKRLYASALTPDLYRPMYGEKVVDFFDQLLSTSNANRPLMASYYDTYFDLYWDLHLGVKGEAIPDEVRQVGESFNTVLAYVNPILDIVHDNYVRVRTLRKILEDWVDARIEDMLQGKIPNPEKTFVYYWLKNGEQGPDFRREDVVFECFHNFVALSQWGNTIYQIVSRLRTDDQGDPIIGEWFKRTMESDFDQPPTSATPSNPLEEWLKKLFGHGSDSLKSPVSPFTPLDRFVMELFRTISPNDGSISLIEETGNLTPLYQRYGYIINPHSETSRDPRHWLDPNEFNPDRYLTTPTSDQIDEARAKEIGFARCPFHKISLAVKDGRNAILTNSAFGTVFGVNENQSFPVCDYAGYAPFGFGYRRCPGELLTIEFVKDFLRKVWSDKVEFKTLDIDNPERVPVGPTAVVDDNIGFVR